MNFVPLLVDPLALCVAVVDTYLILTALVLISRLFARAGLPRPHWIFGHLIEGPAQTVEQRLIPWSRRPVSVWLAWAIVIGAALTLRRLLIALIVLLS